MSIVEAIISNFGRFPGSAEGLHELCGVYHR